MADDKNTEFVPTPDMLDFTKHLLSNRPTNTSKMMSDWMHLRESRAQFAIFENHEIAPTTEAQITVSMDEVINHRQHVSENTVKSTKEQIMRVLEGSNPGNDLDLDLQRVADIEATNIVPDHIIKIDFTDKNAKTGHKAVLSHIIRTRLKGIDTGKQILSQAESEKWSVTKLHWNLLKLYPDTCDLVIVIRGIGLYQDEDDAKNLVRLLWYMGARLHKEQLKRLVEEADESARWKEFKELAKINFTQAKMGSWQQRKQFRAEFSRCRQRVFDVSNPIGPVLRVMFMGPGSNVVKTWMGLNG